MNQPLLLFSKLELLLKGLGECVFSSVLHLEGPHYSFLGQVALHLNFGVLFPGSHTLWHIEFDFFFKEDIHLLLYWIDFSGDHEGSGIVDTGHLVEVFMGVGVAPHHVELGIEDVFSMTPVLNAVVNNQLDHDFLGFFAME